MRVVLSSGSRTWGGLEHMTFLLARGLAERGHHVVLFCRRGSPVEERLRHVVDVEPLLGGGRFHPLTLLRCLRALRRHRPDVVIGNTTKDPSWTGFAARVLGIPYVYRNEFNRPYHDPPRTRLLFGWVPALHVVNSQASRQTTLGHTWIEPEAVRVIPNGVEVEAIASAAPANLDLPEGATVFGFVGRYEEQKGIFELADAWQRVSGTLPDSHLVIVGWGDLEIPFRSALGDAPNVHWLGFRADVHAVLRAFDVLVAPFHQEGFGLVVVEAMAAGVPVVAARASSAPELLDDGAEGLLVPPRDGEALAEAMLALGRDPALRAGMGAAGQARARQDFDMARMVEAHERLLEAVSGRRRPASPVPFGPGSPRRA